MNIPVIIIGIITLLLIWWYLSESIKIIECLKSKGKDVSFVKGKIFKYYH